MPNFANNVFAAQAMALDCSNEIMNAHANYEVSRLNNERLSQIETDEIDEYNQLVAKFNNLLEKALSIESNRNELLQINQQLQEDNTNSINTYTAQESEIAKLKEQLYLKDQALLKAQTEIEKLQETVFTFSLVNIILSTNSNALKNVLNNWNETNVYKKQSFISALKIEIKKLDAEKNQVPTTNSKEAFAYLEINNNSVFRKLNTINI